VVVASGDLTPGEHKAIEEDYALQVRPERLRRLEEWRRREEAAAKWDDEKQLRYEVWLRNIERGPLSQGTMRILGGEMQTLLRRHAPRLFEHEGIFP
jgi:hypothetical protein